MPSTKNGGNIKFGIDFEANQASLNKLKKSLQDLQKIKLGDFKGSAKDFDQMQQTAKKVQIALEKAFNPTLNTTNIKTFQSELQKTVGSIDQVYNKLKLAGPQGEVAFHQMATEVLTTNLKLKETNSLIDSMGKTMVNTVKWGIASSIMNTFTQSVQGAFQYVQSLEKSLTNIRIVTGDSTEKMAQFAEQANRSAQALGRSTLDYTKASLTFYQQGLNEEDVQARTEATLKAQNITGAGSQMADYLTAVWNGYKVANEEAEVYVDKLAAVADSSASDMSQLAIAMSKVASTASTMGVDVDQLNAQIATVVATTRQAPESVGTAFKTIYTRMNDIKAGSDEAEISLGRYSGKMAELGFNVLDATGNLRDTGQVMEEIGDRWEDLTREQQVYLAQTMGGQRQVNQLMALFDNWTTYSELLNTSLESEGTLAEKNSRYMESLGAKMEQLGAAGERVKDALINENELKGGVQALTNLVNLMGNFIESIGGGSTALLAFGALATQVFQDTIARQINNVITNIQNKKNNKDILEADIKETERYGESEGYERGVITHLVDNKKAIQGYYDIMEQGEINAYNNIIKTVAAQEQQTVALQKSKDAGEQFKTYLEKIPGVAKQLKEDLGGVAQNFSLKAIEAGEVITQNWNFKKIRQDSEGFIESVSTAFDDLTKSFGGTQAFQGIDSYEAFQKIQEELSSLREQGIQPTEEQIETLFTTWKNFTKELSIESSNVAILDETNSKLDLAKAKLEASEKSAKNFRNQIEQLATVRSFTQLISGIGQFAAGLRGVINLTKVWKNENLSTGEKVLQTFTNLSMTIPMLMNSYNKLKTASLVLLGSEAKKEAAKLKILELQTKQKEKQIALGKLAELEANPMSTLAEREAAEKAFQGLVKETESLKGEINILNNQSKDFFGLLSAKIPEILGFLGSIAPILIGVGAIAAGIFLAYKEWNKEADAAKKASEVAADAKKTYDDLKTSLQDIKSALEDLHSAEDNLDGLTKGTQEWRDALQQCNDKVLELISNYPELAQYVTNENGQLKLNADGEQAYLDQLQAGVQNARNASYIASSNSREADAMAAAAGIGHNSSYGTNTAGQGGGYASAEQVKTVVQAIDKVIGEGADLKGGLSGLTDKIVDQTGQNEELVKAILSNEDAVLQLRTQLQQNETADKLMYETMAQGALANNSTFKGMDQLGQQVASAIGGADLQKAIQDNQEEWMKIMRNDMSRFSNAATDSVSKVLDALNDAQGTNWKLDSNAVRGGINDRTLAFLDEQGKLHQFTAQQIASTIAAKQALEDLGASAEDASKVLVSIDSKVSDTAKDAVKQWASGQDMTSLTRNGLGDLQGQNLTDIFNEDELKSLAEVRNIDIEQTGWQDKLQQDWDKSLQYISSAFDNVAKDASNTVQTAFSNIKNNDSIKNASLEFQQMVVEDMQQAFDKGGKNSLDQISKLYGEQIQDFEKFDSVIKDFDFSKGAIALGDALKEAGAATDISTQALQAYIKIQQQQAKTLSPEGTYAAVHEVTDKVKKRGDKIDANQAAVLTEAGVNVDSFFVRLLDGSYKLITSIDAFQQHINNVTVQPFKAKMTELQAQIDGIHTFENGAYSSKNMNIEEFSSAAGNISNITGTDAQVVTGQDTDKLRAQVEFLKIVGEEDRAIAQAEEAINQKRTLGAEYLQRISTLIKEHANDYENLSEVEKQLLEQASAVQDSISNTLKPPLDQDVKEETWEKLTQHLADYADQIDGVSADLKDNAEAAGDVAEAVLRYDSALGKVKKNFDGWLESLSSDSIADHAQIAEQLQNVYSDLLDLPFDNVLSDNFLQNVDNLNLLKQAANGSEQAYKELQETAAQDILAQVGLDDSQFYIDKDAIEQSLYQLTGQEWDDIEIGASLDDEAFLNELTNMVNAAGMTAEQATDYLASMGVDAEVIEHDTTATENQTAIGYRPVETGPQTFTDTVSYFGPDGQIQTGQVHYAATGYSYEAIPIENQAEKQNKSFSLEVKSAKKASGGGFKYRNASAGNKGGSGKKGGGKKGGGGGGSKAKEPNKAKGATNKADRYRNNTVKANKLANQMTKLNKQQERLTGKDALKNLQKQLEILEKQKDVIRERLGLQRDEQNELANNLKKYGATFDKDGTLNNYFTTHDKILKEYNDKVAQWNRMTAEQQESNKDYLNNAKEIMDQAFKDLERYDKLQQEIAKTQQEQIDKTQEQINLKVKQLDLKIKAELDLSEAKRDWNKFQKDIVNEIRDDDILGLNRFRFADLASYYNDAETGSIQNLTDRLKEVMGDENGIFSGSYLTQQLANMSITDRAAQLEKIKEIFDDLQDQMEGFKEIADEIKESIFDAIDAAQDAFDEQMDEYEYLGDLIDHNMKITEMFFGDEAYDQMAKFYDRIEENNNAQLDFLAKQKDLWYSRMVEEQARMNQIAQTQGTDSNLYKEARDRREEYKKHWMDTVKDLNSTVEDALDNIMDKYNNAINGILANFELKLGDGHTLDDIEDEWDILNDQADRYFDKINAAYEIDKLENAFNDAIDDNDGNLAAQQSLNDLMEQQLAYLRDKERLTQYDVDRANTLLQIEMKRLALEQSRSNKNRLRLRRDSQGNYTYQYTADTDAINKAEQELADARNSLYNSDKAAYVDNLSDIQKSAENIKDKLEDIWTDENLSKEQKLQKSYELEKYYGDQINKLLEDNANIRNNLIQSSTEELARIYGINIEQFQALSDKEQTDILKDLIPQAGSYLSNMVEGLIGQGGIGKLFDDSINRFLQAEDERINNIAEVEKNGQINFEDTINDINTVIGQAEQLIDNNEALINSYEQELNAVQNTINGVNDLIQTYERAKQAAIQAATAANDLLIGNDAETIGSSLDREVAAQNTNDNVLNSWIANGNSYGDLSNFTPYSPNWHSSDFAAIFGSSNVGLSDLANYQDTLQNATSNILNNIVNQDGYTTSINVNSILDTIESNVSHINDILEALYTDNSNYYANVLDKAKDIEKAIVTNQTVHIDADFPNAKDVHHIIEAIEGLANAAAQRANSKGY